MKNSNLHKARKAKNDEFYTQLIDIEKELIHYNENLCNKIVYCNCDDYRVSNFVKYFKNNFTKLKLKKLIATNYNIGSGAYKYEFDGVNENIIILKGNGDFRSDECIEFLKEADVVVTNPPFSLFREYVAQLMEYDKKFLILGNIQAITYKEVFPFIKNNKLWLGCSTFNSGVYFKVPNDYQYADTYKFDRERNGKKVMRVSSICWYTNIEYSKRHHPIDLYRRYNQEDYPKYDNYDAINVDKVSEIPIDYDGVMGVPITFLGKYCPEQFEIVSLNRESIDGKLKYARIIIRRLKE